MVDNDTRPPTFIAVTDADIARLNLNPSVIVNRGRRAIYVSIEDAAEVDARERAGVYTPEELARHWQQSTISPRPMTAAEVMRQRDEDELQRRMQIELARMAQNRFITTGSGDIEPITAEARRRAHDLLLQHC